MDCCLLSAEEVGQLKHYNIQPNHDNHTHITTKKAIEHVKSGELDIIDHKDGRFYVTTPRMYYLAPVKSAGVIEVIQRVLGPQPLHISPY
jgi:hypothetical protein